MVALEAATVLPAGFQKRAVLPAHTRTTLVAKRELVALQHSELLQSNKTYTARFCSTAGC